jgi:hypothetical protein
MAGKFKQFVNAHIEFENGYQVFFDAGGVAPFSVWAHLWCEGSRVSMDQFVSDKMNGYFTTEEFAKLLFRVSKAPKPSIIEDEDECHQS